MGRQRDHQLLERPQVGDDVPLKNALGHAFDRHLDVIAGDRQVPFAIVGAGEEDVQDDLCLIGSNLVQHDVVRDGDFGSRLPDVRDLGDTAVAPLVLQGDGVPRELDTALLPDDASERRLCLDEVAAVVEILDGHVMVREIPDHAPPYRFHVT